MSGFFERLIEIVKSHLGKVLGKLILSQHLEVLLFEFENFVNFGPLT